MHLTEIFKNKVHGKQQQRIIDFFNILFKSTLHDAVIEDLNPCQQMSYFADGINSEDHNGQFLSLDFIRIYDQKEIVEVLVTVRDVTSEIILARQLAEAEESGEGLSLPW